MFASRRIQALTSENLYNRLSKEKQYNINLKVYILIYNIKYMVNKIHITQKLYIPVIISKICALNFAITQ